MYVTKCFTIQDKKANNRTATEMKWNIQKYANAVQKKKELNKILKTKDKQVWTSGSWAELDRDRTPQQGVMSAQMGLREKLLSVLVIKVV